MVKKLTYSFLLIFLAHFSYTQSSKFGFDKLLKTKPDKEMSFALVYEGQKTMDVLQKNKLVPKMLNREWVYVNCSPRMVQSLMQSGQIKDFYYENSRPELLNDSTRVKSHVNEVHQGIGGLSMPYTAKNVVVGIVDDGIDFRHPDFMDANGKTRFLYLWDHRLDSVGHPNIPQPYGYGLVYDSSYINRHIATAQSANPAYPTLGGISFHGTNVSGIAAGNGLANGTNAGMAPDSKLIMVRSDFSLENWTLTIADACQFIFDKADELGLPCVINLSLGEYFGSHDGKDPAAVAIENMLDAKPGRIVVCAAGNSGNVGKYHVSGTVDADTSFLWLRNNPNGAFGSNTIYMDLWADLNDMQNVRYSVGANLSNGNYASRTSNVFRNALTSVGSMIRDTLKNQQGQRIAVVEFYPAIEYGNYHLEMLFSIVDSVGYNFRFATTGSGKYDAWSGQGFGLNAFVENIPNVATFPSIIHYHAPDSLQTIVSSWACSEKVITVGNFVNRQSYVDLDGLVQLADPAISGKLSVNSSKGPSRVNLTKPDVCAPGDFSASAAPLTYLANSANNFRILQGGWHNVNGGTSMASPVVAGIAALYLEKCSRATYQDFKNDLLSTAFGDNFTGTLPNNAYGNGRVHALNTLLEKNYDVQIVGPTLLCAPQDVLSLTSSAVLDSSVWNFNTVFTNTSNLTIDAAGTYSVLTYNTMGCVESAQTSVTQGQAPPAPVISLVNNVLTSTVANNYQWYLNGSPISGQTLQVLIGTINPTGQYMVATTGPDGCVSFSNIYQQNQGINELETEYLLYPNPVETVLYMDVLPAYDYLLLTDAQGKVFLETTQLQQEIDFKSFAKGVYFLTISSGDKIFTAKISKM